MLCIHYCNHLIGVWCNASLVPKPLLMQCHSYYWMLHASEAEVNVYFLKIKVAVKCFYRDKFVIALPPGYNPPRSGIHWLHMFLRWSASDCAITNLSYKIIGASLSEPHTSVLMQKFGMCMYVCISLSYVLP